MLNSVGLRDSPIRLSSDQLTSFTALRLIAMRSCSAYVDIYVSIVVALLTILRLYAILRALTYYRKLRHLTDQRSHRDESSSGRLNNIPKQIWTSFYNQQAPSVPGGGALFAAAQHQMISQSPRLNNSMTDQNHKLPNGNHHFSLEPQPQYQERQQPDYRTASMLKQQPIVLQHKNALRKARQLTPSLYIMPSQNGRHSNTLTGKTSTSVSPLKPLRTKAHNTYSQKTVFNSMASGRSKQQPDVLLVNAQRLAGNQSREDFLRHFEVRDDEGNETSNTNELGQQSDNLQNIYTFASPPSEPNSSSPIELISKSSPPPQQQQQPQTQTRTNKLAYNTIKSNGTTYALLTADQLDKLGKKLLLPDNKSATTGRYKLMAKYKQVQQPVQQQQQQITLNDLKKQILLHDGDDGARLNTATSGDSGLVATEEQSLSVSTASSLASLDREADSEGPQEVRLVQTTQRKQRRSENQARRESESSETDLIMLNLIKQHQREQQRQERQERQEQQQQQKAGSSNNLSTSNFLLGQCKYRDQ